MPGPPATVPGPSRGLLLALALVALAAAPAAARSALVAELDAVAVSYHQDLPRLDRLRQGLERAAAEGGDAETLIALARVCFIWGDVRAQSAGEKLAAYDQGRQAARRAVALAPRNPAAHFWFATNTGRWGQTKGVVRSLFLLPDLKRGIDTVLELDPGYTPVYALLGNVYYEVPALLGGDLEKAEWAFRKGLALDARFTGMRVGLGKTLIRLGRAAEARRELEAVLAERNPTNPADWAVKDAPEARRLLGSI
jgi:hypothetical protein